MAKRLRLALYVRHLRLYSQAPPSRSKVYASADEAITDLKSGSSILCGGFGLCGVPDTLIKALNKQPEKKDLTVVSNNAGVEDGGVGLLFRTQQVSKMIASFIGENKNLKKLYLDGEIEVELTPQGTIAERCRAGAAGVPAFFTPTAVDTFITSGDMTLKFNKDGTVLKRSLPKEIREFNGKKYILQEAIYADYAFVKAWKADTKGNLQFRLAAYNFNGVMARNAKTTIVEAENIVEPGEIDPSSVHVPGIYVDRIVPSTEPKRIAKYTFAKSKEELLAGGSSAEVSKRETIVKRAAKEFKSGMYINLGLGIPTLVPNFLQEGVDACLQSENGIIGLGPYPQRGEEDPDLINAGKEIVTLDKGASLFGSEESFAMIRSGKIDMTILGAMQVSAHGDLANWALPGSINGMGGAMDLVANPEKTKVLITMEHTDKKGNPKVVEKCTFPLTGRQCVWRIITDLAVFDADPITGLTLLEVASADVTVDEIRSKTEAAFRVADNLTTFSGDKVH